jgi:hypothetical protein
MSNCFFFGGSYIEEAAQVVVEVVFATVDHSDIRGSKSHNRDPSGAASDYKRGFGPKTYRIELSRILLSVYPSTTTHAASFELLGFRANSL